MRDRLLRILPLVVLIAMVGGVRPAQADEEPFPQPTAVSAAQLGEVVTPQADWCGSYVPHNPFFCGALNSRYESVGARQYVTAVHAQSQNPNTLIAARVRPDSGPPDRYERQGYGVADSYPAAGMWRPVCGNDSAAMDYVACWVN